MSLWADSRAPNGSASCWSTPIVTLARPKADGSDAARYLWDDVPYVLGVDVDPGLPLRR